jgi:2-hydroxychromene-2-carboxylate isomerase
MTPIMTAVAARAALALAVAAGAMFSSPQHANAFSFRVKMACASDYFANCSAYGLESKEVRSLVADGEVSAAEVAKKRAAARSASTN